MLEFPGRFSPLLHKSRPSPGQTWSDASTCDTWHEAMAEYLEEREAVVRAMVQALDTRCWPRLFHQDTELPPQLAGITVGVKDIFHACGFATQAGTALPSSLLQGSEASIVSRLRMAGANIIGKTVTTEFAYFEPGPTTNPWHQAYTPGGSSSGSAAGVAAGFFDVGLGTQTVGSVIRPASYCGIQGYKPTLGRIARDGLLLFSDTVDHVGLMSRDWTAMQSVATEVVDGWNPAAAAFQEPVFGLIHDEYLEQAEPSTIRYVQEWSLRLRDVGFEVKPLEIFDHFPDLVARHRDLIAYEFSFRHQPWLGKFEHLYRPRTIDLIRHGREVPQIRWQECRRSCRELREYIQDRMKEEKVDVLLSPATVGTAPYGLDFTGDPVMNLPWTHAGVPVTTMPMGLAEDSRGVRLPLGIQLIAAMGKDEFLLGLSREVYERVPPLDRI